MKHLLIVLFAFATVCSATEPATSDNESATAKQKRNDQVYIPENLEDCFRELDKRLDPEDIKKIQSGEITPVDMHFGLGMGLRNSWELWGRSRLAEYFVRMGIHHPDDMSGIVLESYVRYLRKEPIRLDEQVAHYKEYWAKAQLPMKTIIVDDLPAGTEIKPSKPHAATSDEAPLETARPARTTAEKEP